MYQLSCSIVQLDLTIVYKLTHLTCYMSPNFTTTNDSSTTTITNTISLQYKVSAAAIQQTQKTTMPSITIGKEVHNTPIWNIPDTSSAHHLKARGFNQIATLLKGKNGIPSYLGPRIYPFAPDTNGD